MRLASALELRSLTVSYGATPVVRGLSLEARAGELVALLGPSGCGKTTVLKTIAGLVQPSQGQVIFGGEVVDSVPPEKRGVALVFQSPLLFPHLSVGENVAFGLKMKRLPRPEIAMRVAQALDMVRLHGFEHRRPRQLSGGQEQRVALARALVTDPKILLLDEPFSALDENLRDEMRSLVRSLQRRLRMTTIFVTHDHEEAVRVADRIALLLDGHIAQSGTARDFYTAPASAAVARFFNWQVFEGACRNALLETPIGRFPLPAQHAGCDRVAIAFRAESARVGLSGSGDTSGGDFEIDGTVQDAVYFGGRIRYFIVTPSGAGFQAEEAFRDTQCEAIASGGVVKVRIANSAIRFFMS